MTPIQSMLSRLSGTAITLLLVAVGLSLLSIPFMPELLVHAWAGFIGVALLGLAALSLSTRLRRTSAEADGLVPLLIITEDSQSSSPAWLEQSAHWRLAGVATPAQWIKAALALGVRHACLDLPACSHAVRRSILADASRAGITLYAFPDLSAGEEMATTLKRLRIDDLLLQDATEIDASGVIDLLTARVVLVTGAGGSIGSELCRQIARHHPSLLVLFEQNEFAMYSVEQVLKEEFPHLPIVAMMGDIKSEARVRQMMQRFNPSVIFHAAAYKHVPLMEDLNAWEAIRNNVLGTYVLAKAAIDLGVEKFVFVSTDKAVNPTNVMGASKRLAEMVCQALQQTTSLPKFEMVRFGNVLGSAGSVIPRFEEQIARGGPVTVTHPDMVRYFMSIPEAAQLVLQAGSMGLGGEIFLMDMGKPVKILELAEDMIRLSGAAESSIAIEFSGLRPGEKLFEELLADDEHTRATPHPRLRIAKAREVPAGWLQPVLDWVADEAGPDEVTLRRDLKRWVPEYVSAVRPRLRAISGGQAR